MSALDDVKGWMTFFGWTQQGGPGAVKTEYGGTVVARHGDAKWQQDVEYACYRAEMAKRDANLIDEIDATLSRSEVPAAPPVRVKDGGVK